MMSDPPDVPPKEYRDGRGHKVEAARVMRVMAQGREPVLSGIKPTDRQRP